MEIPGNYMKSLAIKTPGFNFDYILQQLYVYHSNPHCSRHLLSIHVMIRYPIVT